MGMFARTNSNDFFGFQRENSLVTKHLCLTWDATVRITDSPPALAIYRLGRVTALRMLAAIVTVGDEDNWQLETISNS